MDAIYTSSCAAIAIRLQCAAMPGDGFADGGAPAGTQGDAALRFEPSEPEAEAPADPDAPGEAAQPDAPSDAVPLFDPAEHLDLLLRRFAGRLERHRRRRDPAQLDAGRVFTIERRLAAFEAEIAARVAASDPAALPIVQLQRRFALGDLAIEFLIGAAAPGLDLAIGRAIAELHADQAQCDVGFLAGVLTDDPVDLRILLGELSELAPLVRYRLVRLAAPRGWQPEGPLLLAPVAVPDRVARWLRGETHFEGARF